MKNALQNRNQFIADNLGLVHSLAGRFKGRGIEYEDLYQAGCMGLVKAADGFDPDRGFAFSTYAVPVILGEIKRLFRDGGAVKVSRSLKDLSAKVAKCREQLAAQLGQEPTIACVANEMGLSCEQVSEAIGIWSPVMSLSGEEEGEGSIDVPVSGETDRITDRIILRQAISALQGQDRKLIILRYFCEISQARTGQILSMTQVQVSRREKKILSQMKRLLEV